MGRVPLVLGQVERVEVQDGKVRLHLRGLDGSAREIVTEHIIAATGYKVDVERLAFLAAGIRSKLKCVNKHRCYRQISNRPFPGYISSGSRQQIASGR